MRDEDDKHAEMIHFLRNSTQLSRFSRMEVRDFIERLDAEGYVIVPKADALDQKAIVEKWDIDV
jgi:hypothetical protein